MRIPVVLALDRLSDLDVANLVRETASKVEAFKVHHQVDRSGVSQVMKFVRSSGGMGSLLIFDLKPLDIPDTVLERVREIVSAEESVSRWLERTPDQMGPIAVTAHASGGSDMLKRAVDTGVKVFAITVLTSLTDGQCLRLCNRTRAEQVAVLADEAKAAGCYGIVGSVNDLGALVPMNLGMKIMVPGTRSVGVKTHDQKQVNTPAYAIEHGADLLVIGRQVMEAPDRVVALNALAQELELAREARIGRAVAAEDNI